MKSKKICSAVFTSLIFIFTFNSCNDDSNQPTNSATGKITVSGKVTNVVNQAASNIKVIISGKDSAVTSADGSFSISEITAPYNLQIIDVAANVIKYYHGVTESQIRIPGVGIVNGSIVCEITVTYPPEIFTPNIDGKVMFTDGNYVNSYESFSQGLPFTVWLPDNSPVTGKLILITYKKDGSGKIISYENFGQSASIQVSNGGNYTYNFSPDEVSLNPGENILSGSINLQPGYDSDDNFFYLTFSNKRTPNYSIPLRFETISSNVFNILVPTNLPLQYSSMLGCYSFNGQLSNTEIFKLPPGPSGINLDTKTPPELLTPENNAIDVNLNTEFTFTSGTGTGIYLINLHNETLNKRYTIYTSSNRFRLSEFSDLFTEGISGSLFSWSVEKTGFDTSVNEFLTRATDRPDYYTNHTAQRNFTVSN